MEAGEEGETLKALLLFFSPVGGNKIPLDNPNLDTKAQGKKIVARCNTFEEKITILQSKKEMKSMERGTPVYVDDDLPKEDRETQAKIRNEAKKRRDEGSQVKVAGTRMKIDNIWYRWNELTNQPEPFRNQARGTADRDILEHPGSQK